MSINVLMQYCIIEQGMSQDYYHHSILLDRQHRCMIKQGGYSNKIKLSPLLKNISRNLYLLMRDLIYKFAITTGYS